MRSDRDGSRSIRCACPRGEGDESGSFGVLGWSFRGNGGVLGNVFCLLEVGMGRCCGLKGERVPSGMDNVDGVDSVPEEAFRRSFIGFLTFPGLPGPGSVSSLASPWRLSSEPRDSLFGSPKLRQLCLC